MIENGFSEHETKLSKQEAKKTIFSHKKQERIASEQNDQNYSLSVDMKPNIYYHVNREYSFAWTVMQLPDDRFIAWNSE